MDFEQLRIFMILAEEGTYLGAANRLKTSRSRVRRKIDQLALDAGTALLFRDQATLRLTPAGEVLVRRGKVLLDDAERLISHVRDIGTIPTGRLKIAMPTGPPPAGWDRIRRELQTRYPDLKVELYFDEHPASLLPRQAEMAITYDDDLPDGCSVIEIGEYPLRLFASASYLESFGSPESVQDLRRHRVAMWRSPNGRPGLISLDQGRSIQLEPHLLADDPALLYRMAVDGEFIAYLPELPHLRDPSLKTLFAEELRGIVHERLVVPNILADLPRVQELVLLTQRAFVHSNP